MKYFITYVDDVRTNLLNRKWKNRTNVKHEADLIWMLYKNMDFFKHYNDEQILNHFQNSYMFCIKSYLVKLSKINYKINAFTPKN